MNLKITILILNILALIGCIIWLIIEGGWEPVVAIIISISTLIGQTMKDEESKKVIMKQRGGKKSTMFQSGGDINITT